MGRDAVWIFNGSEARFASAVFYELEDAEAWIRQYRLSGILTKYPTNCGVYDWAIEKSFFNVKKEEQRTPAFIGSFTSASMEHYHFEDGVKM